VEPAAISSAVLTRLATISGLTVLDGEVKTTPPGPYVVLYDQPPSLSTRRMSGQQTHMDWNGLLICAGRAPGEVRWVVGQVIAKLTNYRITSNRDTGWLVYRPEGAPMLPSDAVPGDIRFSQTLPFSLSTNRSLA
jgi:hypothetical protein